MPRILHRLKDFRLNSASLLVEMTMGEYLVLARPAYERRGAIEGQRTAVKTTSALRIRERMKSDFLLGAILPPVVVGVLTDTSRLDESETWSDSDLDHVLKNLEGSAISIIDGMQRTTVFIDSDKSLQDRPIRVELWFVKETSSLTYRMLVLNTGQVPWNLRRQIEVINASLLQEIQQAVRTASAGSTVPGQYTPLQHAINIFGIDDGHRRTAPGEFQANEVVEMYLSFGLRKEKVDTETVLADQFSRLDMVEAVSNANFLSGFIVAFLALIRLDFAFSTYQPSAPARRKFATGRNLFDSVPACVGFMAAVAQKVFGRPGSVARDLSSQTKALEDVAARAEEVSRKFVSSTEEEKAAFLDLEVLNEVIGQPAGKIGDYEREVFVEAFRVFFSHDDEIASLTPCWRAR